MAKGGDFERTICKELSLWWTYGKRDDVFWRSSQSGGRATTRHKQGKSTAGSCGDIAAIDPKGLPLLDLMTIEVKRGYNSETLANLLERNQKAAQQMWEAWIQQAHEAHERAGSFSWIIIAKRDRREDIVLMHRDLADILQPYWLFRPYPLFQVRSVIRFKHVEKKAKKETIIYTAHRMKLVAMTWASFKECLTPDIIRQAGEKA